jgi:hypothetical protein
MDFLWHWSAKRLLARLKWQSRSWLGSQAFDHEVTVKGRTEHILQSLAAATATKGVEEP